jgi:tetratricopeptide (TPR) repeat protein
MHGSSAERKFHRKVASRCFNKAWEYLAKSRKPSEELDMLNVAHASRYHWGLVGEPRNLAIGDWQISRAYAALGEAQLALKYAKSSMACCEQYSLAEIVHTAYEAAARAYVKGGDVRNAKVYLRKARKHLHALKMAGREQGIYLSQIEETEAMLRALGH